MKKLNTLLLINLFALFAVKTSYAQVPSTQLRSIDCGKINLTPAAQIACLPVASANLYQWEFRDINTNAVVGTKNTNGTAFAPIMVSFLQWNTQYNVAIRARVGSTFGTFGASCTIGLMQDPAITGVPSTALRPQFCNSNNLLISSTISCAPVPMGTLYEFEFTNTITQQLTFIVQGSIYVTLSNPSLALQIGQTYEVRTRAFVFNTWSIVTTVCNVAIQTPVSNVLASFNAPACEGSALHLTSTFQGGIPPYTYAWTGPNGFTSNQQNPTVNNPVSGDYSVIITGSFSSGSGNSSTAVVVNPTPLVPSITGDFDFCPNNVATLDAGTGYDSYSWSNGMQTQTTIILLPAVYTVTVANSFGCTATATIEVAPCVSNVATTQVRDIDCGKINLTPNAQFACNPVTDATNYQWEFRNPTTLALYASFTSNYIVAFGDAISPALQFNTQYVTRVRAKVAGEWGNYATLCTIGLGENPAITGVLPTQLRPQFCNVTNMPINTTIACDPVSMGMFYEFEFTDLSDNNVVIVPSNLIYLNLQTISPALIGGHTYAVRARGFVYNTWSNFGSACNITISNSIIGAGSRESASQILAIDEATPSLIVNSINEELMAYPNPFENQSGFIVKSNQNSNVTVYLFDAVGKIVWSKQVPTNQYQQYNTTDIAPGFYFMSTSENNNNTVKIIKTK